MAKTEITLRKTLTDISTRNIDQVISSNTITLARIIKENGQDSAIKILVEDMAQVNQLLNDNSKISIETMEATAVHILREYKLMKLDEIRFAIHQGLTGVYGQMFGALDGVKILWWIREFDIRKTNLQEDKLEQEHSDRKSETGRY